MTDQQELEIHTGPIFDVMTHEARRQDAAVIVFMDKAIASGNIDAIERAAALVERRENLQKLMAFNRAMAMAKPKIPAIIKDRAAKFDHRDGRGKTAYFYAELASICRAVDQPLSEHGIYYRWRTEDLEGNGVRVTCIVFHAEGHSEDNSLSAAADTSGSKNPIQAKISAVTYLKRDTLCSALGIAAGRDDDAQAAGGNGGTETAPITAEEVEKIQTKVVALGIDLNTFYAVMSKHAGMPIERVSDLLDSHLKYCWQQLEMFERNQKKVQAAQATQAAQSA